MPIMVDCDCGASMKAPDRLAGMPVKCPRCKRTLVVPGWGGGEPRVVDQGFDASLPMLATVDSESDLPSINSDSIVGGPVSVMGGEIVALRRSVRRLTWACLLGPVLTFAICFLAIKRMPPQVYNVFGLPASSGTLDIGQVIIRDKDGIARADLGHDGDTTGLRFFDKEGSIRSTYQVYDDGGVSMRINYSGNENLGSMTLGYGKEGDHSSLAFFGRDGKLKMNLVYSEGMSSLTMTRGGKSLKLMIGVGANEVPFCVFADDIGTFHSLLDDSGRFAKDQR